MGTGLAEGVRVGEVYQYRDGAIAQRLQWSSTYCVHCIDVAGQLSRAGMLHRRMGHEVLGS